MFTEGSVRALGIMNVSLAPGMGFFPLLNFVDTSFITQLHTACRVRVRQTTTTRMGPVSNMIGHCHSQMSSTSPYRYLCCQITRLVHTM